LLPRSSVSLALTDTIEAAPPEHQRRLINALRHFHPELGSASAVHGDAAALLEDIIDASKWRCGHCQLEWCKAGRCSSALML
jgi:hypothetical protein